MESTDEAENVCTVKKHNGRTSGRRGNNLGMDLAVRAVRP